MRTKCLILMVSTLFMLCLSAAALAQWVTDPTGDTANSGTVGDYDIERAKVEFFEDGPGLEEWVYICVDMTQSMPGMLLVEFDVDPAVGSSVSLASLFNPCERPAGPKIKDNVAGYDITLNIFLRDQDQNAATAYCLDCLGPPAGTCMERTSPCSGCDQAGCYTSGDTCQPGDPACYLRGPVCTSGGDACTEGSDFCSVMNELCTENNPCNLAKIEGEWTVNPYVNSGSQQRPADRGRIVPSHFPGPDEEGDSACFKLPWAMMVESVWSASPFFDKSSAEDPANIKWQLSTWYDTGGNDDFLQGGPPPCPAVTDVVPNTDSSPAQGSDGGICHYYQKKFNCCLDQQAIDAQDNICMGNLHPLSPLDGDVDGSDASQFKADFGRGGYTNPCPCETIEP